MQENNFEKKVQQELDGLRLNPSAEVWLKVEASLKKKKDRRLLVLLVSLFFLLGAGFLAYNFYRSGSTHKQTEVAGIPAQAEKSQPASGSLETFADSNSTTAGATVKTDSFQTQPQSKKSASLLVQINPGKTGEKHPSGGDGKSAETAANQQKTLLYKTSKIRRYLGAKTSVQAADAIVGTIEEAETTAPLTKQHATFNLSGLTVSRLKPGLNFTNDLISGKALTLPDVGAEKQPAAARSKTKTGKKVGIALEAGIGRSGTANSYLGTIPNNLFYDATPLNSSVGGSVTVPDSLRPYNINPSALKPGAGFFAGILFTKKISGRSSISAGVRYQLITTSQTVGASVSYASNNTQRQDGVFKAGIGNSYTNSYHLLQIPIEFNTQLTGFKQHNIYATTGISVSQLVYTNALQFDNVSRQYFKDNSFFNKTSVGFSAAVFVNLAKKAKPSLLLGPSFQYNFTPLADKGLYANSHYSFLGLRLQKAMHHK